MFRIWHEGRDNGRAYTLHPQLNISGGKTWSIWYHSNLMPVLITVFKNKFFVFRIKKVRKHVLPLKKQKIVFYS